MKVFIYECIYDKGITIKIKAYSKEIAKTKLKTIIKSELTFKQK